MHSSSCEGGDGFTDNADDCDDTEPTVNPGEEELCDELDEHWILPGEHPELSIERRDELDIVEVRYRSRYYAAPRADVIVLPINNTSAENLARFLGRELIARLRGRFPDVVVRRLRLAVEETAGQRGVYSYAPD